MRDQSMRRAPVIVRLPAEIDISNMQHVLALLQAVYAAGATVVIADLTSTVFCDTSGLHALMNVQRQASADGAQLRLAVAPDGPVHRVLEIMGVDRLVPVCTSLDNAIALVSTGETARTR